MYCKVFDIAMHHNTNLSQVHSKLYEEDNDCLRITRLFAV